MPNPPAKTEMRSPQCSSAGKSPANPDLVLADGDHSRLVSALAGLLPGADRRTDGRWVLGGEGDGLAAGFAESAGVVDDFGGPGRC